MRTLPFIFLFIISIPSIKDKQNQTLKFNDRSIKAVATFENKIISNQAKKFSVLVLSPYDDIAGRGISPDIPKIVEQCLKRDPYFTLLKLTYFKLHNQYMIYNKKYSKEIINKIRPDIIIMSKVILIKETGDIQTAKWSIEIKAYLPKKDVEAIIYSNKEIEGLAVEKDILSKINLAKVKSRLK